MHFAQLRTSNCLLISPPPSFPSCCKDVIPPLLYWYLALLETCRLPIICGHACAARGFHLPACVGCTNDMSSVAASTSPERRIAKAGRIFNPPPPTLPTSIIYSRSLLFVKTPRLPQPAKPSPQRRQGSTHSPAADGLE